MINCFLFCFTVDFDLVAVDLDLVAVDLDLVASDTGPYSCVGGEGTVTNPSFWTPSSTSKCHTVTGTLI